LYLYEKPEQIRNIKSFLITKSADRFANVHTWYINEDKVWKLISPQK
jgi:hypothetical protein